MKPKIRMRDLVDEDVERVSENTTDITHESFAAMNGNDDTLGSIRFTVDASKRRWTLFLPDDEIVGICGAIEHPHVPRCGFVWFIPAAPVYDHQVEFLRIACKVIPLFYCVDNFHWLLSFIDSKHRRSLEWSKRWLGFTHTLDLREYGSSPRPFHEVIHSRFVSPIPSDRLPEGFEQYRERFDELFGPNGNPRLR